MYKLRNIFISICIYINQKSFEKKSSNIKNQESLRRADFLLVYRISYFLLLPKITLIMAPWDIRRVSKTVEEAPSHAKMLYCN